MKSDLYTKIILTALTIVVFALVYQKSGADGLSPISVAEAKSKNSSWFCEPYLGGSYDKHGRDAAAVLNRANARLVVTVPVGSKKHYHVCYR